MKRNEYYLLQITAYRLPHRLIIRKEIIEYPKVWIETMMWVGKLGNAAMVESRLLENPSLQFVRTINKNKEKKTWHLNT